ncbi:MAG: flippase-like domain-containing protein [Acidobacteria bacterium]|nr:flippase-like domain-containing protein [Acidobacteriota bacterium]
MQTLLRGVGDALAHANLAWVAAAFVLNLIGLAVNGERWRSVCAALGCRLRLSRTTLINLAGIFVRNATPATGLGGDASRVLLLRAEGVPLAQATAAFAYVRLAEIPPIAVTVLLAGPAVAAAARRSTATLAIAAGVLVAALIALSVNRHRLSARVADLWSRTAHLRIAPAAAALAVFYAGLAQFDSLARLMLAATACGLPLSLQQSAAVTAVAIAGGFVPTIGSLGAIEGGMVAALVVCGADVKIAVAITIIERLISFGVNAAAGAGALAWLGGRRLLRAAREETWASTS